MLTCSVLFIKKLLHSATVTTRLSMVLNTETSIRLVLFGGGATGYN